MNTRLQSDKSVRVVALENLTAMCAKISGMAHRYEVTKVSRSRVHVTYSNPDEYGRDRPMTAVYGCYPLTDRPEDRDNPNVVLDILRVIHDDEFGEGWQNFDQLHDCPSLWRDPSDGSWKTHRQLDQERPDVAANPRCACIVCDRAPAEAAS